MAQEQKDEMVIWAKKVTEGMSDSAIFMQLFNPLSDPDEALEDPQYLIQLGYAIMLDKPVIVIASYKQTIPDKLEKVADVIGRYKDGSMKSIHNAIESAIENIESN